MAAAIARRMRKLIAGGGAEAGLTLESTLATQ
jgi:hypothetical protein